MRLLLDTNVLVAAFISRGACYDVIEDAIHSHQVYYTIFITDELKQVFKAKFQYPAEFIDRLQAFISKFFIKGITSDSVEQACKDCNDDQLLADAVANNIDIIITGDKGLLDLQNHKGIIIISPAEYWDI